MRPSFDRRMDWGMGGNDFGPPPGRRNRRFLYQVAAVALIFFVLYALHGDQGSWGSRVQDGLAYVLTTEWNYQPVLEHVVNFGLQTVSVDSPILNNLPYNSSSDNPGSPPATEVMNSTELPGLPVSGRLLREYGWTTDPLDGMERFHPGVDIACPQGTEVKAVLDGTVEQVGEDRQYGGFVLLNHGAGTYTLYAQVQDIAVAEGRQVAAGDIVAKTAADGEVGEPGLHFEYRENGKLVDPLGKFSLSPADQDLHPAGP